MSEKQNDDSGPMLRQSVRVPHDLYDWACQKHDNFSGACRLALEKLREIESEDSEDNQLTEWQTQEHTVTHALIDVQAIITGVMKQQLDAKDRQIEELNATIHNLTGKLPGPVMQLPAGRKWWQIWK